MWRRLGWAWPRSPTKRPEEEEAAAAEAAEEADSLRRMYDAILTKLCSCQAQGAAVATLPPDFASGPPAGVARGPSVHTTLGDLATPAEVRAQTTGLLFAGLNSAKELSAILSLLAANPDLQAEA